MDNKDILNLLENRKKGFMRILFSRFGIVFLLLVVETALLLSVFQWFSAYFKLFSLFQGLFATVMLLYLFNCGMDATAKLTWLFLIALFPIPSTILFGIVKTDIGHRLTVQLLNKRIRETRDLISQDMDVICDPYVQTSGLDDLHHYLNRNNSFPLYNNSDVTYFSSGEKAFDAILADLEKAESFIFMEYFIIDEGYMWGRILKILAEKAAQGVDVRVMYDGMCEAVLLPHDYPKRMEALGIQCSPFTPLTPFLSTQYNYRDHRKILIIDGNVAFTGGINLADEYINKKKRYGHWKDTAIRVNGDAVRSFTLMFLQMWNKNSETPDWSQTQICRKADNPNGFVIPYGDNPMDNDKVGEKVYIDILYRAKRYVHIMTPYLILDNELEMALKYAAERGIDVKLILPGIPDKISAYSIAKTHYHSLLNAGVQIYEYTPGFVHAKVFVSDDEKAVVGSINLDYRSLYHHFECAAYMYRTNCIKDIAADFNETLTKCRKVSYDSIKRDRLIYKILGPLLKALAPLM